MLCSFSQEGKFGIALQQYARVVRLLDGYFSNEEKEKRDPIVLAGHLNLAACHLKLRNNFKCIKECEKVISKSRWVVCGLYTEILSYAVVWCGET